MKNGSVSRISCAGTAGVNTDQQGNQPGHDGRIRVGADAQGVAVTVDVQPDTGLAATEQILVGFFILGQRLELAPQVDQVLVAVQPFGEQAEVVDDGCCSALWDLSWVSDMGASCSRRQRVPPAPSSSAMPSSDN